MNHSPDDIQSQLRALQRDYAARLPEKAADITSRFAMLRDRWSPEQATELRRLVHNLAGSGASYGFPEVSIEARLVERALDAAMPGPPSPGRLDAIGDALRALVAAAVAARPL